MPVARFSSYASFGSRSIALIIDLLLLGAAAAVAREIWHAVSFGAGDAIAGSFFFLGSIAYYTLMESSSKQATVGKMVTGIVVSAPDGRRLTRRQAFTRGLIKAISLPFPLLALVSVITIMQRQSKEALHDMAASSRVIARDSVALIEQDERLPSQLEDR